MPSMPYRSARRRSASTKPTDSCSCTKVIASPVAPHAKQRYRSSLMLSDGVRSRPSPWKGQRALCTAPACSTLMPWSRTTSTRLTACFTACGVSRGGRGAWLCFGEGGGREEEGCGPVATHRTSRVRALPWPTATRPVRSIITR